MALGLPPCFTLPVPLLDDTYHLLAWGEDGTCKQMRHPRESCALELCEVLCTVAGPLSEHHFEIKATTEIIEHLSIIEERRTFIFIPVRNPILAFCVPTTHPPSATNVLAETGLSLTGPGIGDGLLCSRPLRIQQGSSAQARV